jgi:hypothetical protein
VLAPLVVSVGLAFVGTLVIAAVAHLTMRRLGLEHYAVLVWLGLAEAPVDELTARRRGAQPSFGNSTAGARLLYRAK